MDNNSDEQFLIIKSKIESNRQETNEKKMKTYDKSTQIIEDLKILTATITSMKD